jgi:hypothetical protein
MIKINLSQLMEAIDGIEDQVRAAIDEDGLREIGFSGAGVIRDEAKRNALAHKKTGVLERSIIAKRLEERADGGNRQVYLVTVRKGSYGGEDAFYAPFVEKGHKFVPRKKQGTGWRAHR